MENSSENVTIVDVDGTLRYVSPAFGRMLGYDPEEAVGKMNVLDHVHPDDLPHVLEETEKALGQGGVVTNRAEYRFRHKDGSWRWVESIGTYLLEDPYVGVVVQSRDVTERKLAEERFRAQYKNFPLPTYTWQRVGDDFVLVDHNDAAHEYSRGIAGELLGSRATELFDAWPDYLEMIERCFRERTTLRRQMPWRTLKTGDERRFVVTCVFVSPDLVMVHTKDVTERAKAEERLRFQAQLLGAVGEAVIALDMQGRVVYWNRAAQEMYGWSEEEAMGRLLRDLVVPEDLMEQAEDVAAQLREGRHWSGEFVVRRKDGTLFHVEGTDTPVFDDYGEQVGVVGVLRDVTDRKEAEEALRRSEAEVFSILESISDAFFALDNEWRFSFVNRKAGILFQKRREDLIGERIWEDPTFYPHYRRAVAEGTTERFEACYPPVDRWFSVRAYPSKSGLSVYLQDITERKKAEDALRESEQRFKSTFEDAGIGMALLSPDGRFWRANRAFCELLGYAEDELFGMTFREITHPDDLANDIELRNRMLAGETSTFSIQKRYLRKDGSLVWVELTVSLLRDPSGEPLYSISQIQDVTERKALEERLVHQAFHDSLTDLPNRPLFVDRLAHALERTRRTKGRKVAVLFMDLDKFKVVNDSLGHEVGDRVLEKVAQRLKRCLRPEDTLARFGGDEFVVLLEEVGEAGEAVRVAERISEELREPLTVDGRELFVRVSTGVALGDVRTKSPEDLLRDADTAMYRAKYEGVGHSLFEPSMHRRALGRLELENDLRRAIEREEFVVHYQPIVHLDGGEVWGLEALVRWDHPERGLLDPSEFVLVAEESGLVVPMGEMVLGEACRRAVEWQRDFPRTLPLAVAVNLSGRQLRRPDFHEVIEQALKESGLSASSLGLDITETIYISALDANTGAIDRLKATGIRISIDDFGTGYSSLSYLKRLPADILKIDKSFIRGLGVEVEDTAIVQSIVDLAHVLGMEVVAEGVEIEEQETLLREMGCDFAQGFYFCRPLPPEEVPSFLAG